MINLLDEGVNSLDEMERRAIEMVEFFQDECRKQCEPYLKIIADCRNMRPRVMVVDGQTLVPLMRADQTTGAEK